LVSAASRRVLAQTPAATAVALVPTAPVGFVELSAVTVDADLSCVDGACSTAVAVVYSLINKDRLKSAELALGLERSGSADTVAEVGFDRSADSSGTDTWTLRLEPSGGARATLRYVIPLDGRQLLFWAWDPSSLAEWGSPGSVRLTMNLPEALPDDAFLLREPAGYTYSGRTLTWSYEGPSPPDLHRLWVISPGTWNQQKDLSDQGASTELVSLLLEVRAEAVERRAPLPDPYSRAVGILLVALQTDPTPEAFLQLADLYLARSAEQSDLNYRLLAADTLQSAVDQGHADSAVRQRLADVYRSLAEIARQSGDAAQALRYLQLASEQTGSAGEVDAATREELTLGWAVEMAAQGHTSDALVEAGDALSPSVQDALYRYAPPFRSARTEVRQSSGRRTADYYLLLYPPVRERTIARLESLAQELAALPGCSASLDGSAGQEPEIALHVELVYASAQDAAQASAAIRGLSGEEPDFVTALVVAPWEVSPAEYIVTRMPWFDYYVYQERPSLGLVTQVRDEQLQYTLWRLVEVASNSPADERGRFEQQLTGLALRDERQVWENLSASTYWTYAVAFPEPSALPALSWLVGWGQERDLAITHRDYHWEAIAQGVLALAAVLLFIVVLVRMLHRKTARGRHA
ncbi:MAG: tetratricopeptide repeat protein, partial [Anaerolineae bacterium]